MVEDRRPLRFSLGMDKGRSKRAPLLRRASLKPAGCGTRHVPQSLDKALGPHCNEFSYRFSRRGQQLEMFDATLKNLTRGKALPYSKTHFASIGLGLRLLLAFTEVRGTGLALSSLPRSASNFSLLAFIWLSFAWFCGITKHIDHSAVGALDFPSISSRSSHHAKPLLAAQADRVN